MTSEMFLPGEGQIYPTSFLPVLTLHPSAQPSSQPHGELFPAATSVLGMNRGTGAGFDPEH